jgi:hypothetical protein
VDHMRFNASYKAMQVRLLACSSLLHRAAPAGSVNRGLLAQCTGMTALPLCSCATAQVLYLALPAMLSAVAWSTRGIQACLNHLLSLFSPGVLVSLPLCAA